MMEPIPARSPPSGHAVSSFTVRGADTPVSTAECSLEIKWARSRRNVRARARFVRSRLLGSFYVIGILGLY